MLSCFEGVSQIAWRKIKFSWKKRDSSCRKIEEVLAARMRKLIIACARKNKRTARMLANARKDHSIPLYRSASTSKPVYCKTAINASEYAWLLYSPSQKIKLLKKPKYGTAGYENPKPLRGKKGTYTPTCWTQLQCRQLWGLRYTKKITNTKYLENK